jgi:hypothetical protein
LGKPKNERQPQFKDEMRRLSFLIGFEIMAIAKTIENS